MTGFNCTFQLLSINTKLIMAKSINENQVMAKWLKQKSCLRSMVKINLSSKSTAKVNFCQVKTMTAATDRPTICMHVTPPWKDLPFRGSLPPSTLVSRSQTLK